MPKSICWITTNYDLDKRGYDFHVGAEPFPTKHGRYYRMDFLGQAGMSPSTYELERKIGAALGHRIVIFPLLELRLEQLCIHPLNSGIRDIITPRLSYDEFRSLVAGENKEILDDFSRNRLGGEFTHFERVLDFHSNDGGYDEWKQRIKRDGEFKVHEVEIVREVDIPGF